MRKNMRKIAGHLKAVAMAQIIYYPENFKICLLHEKAEVSHLFGRLFWEVAADGLQFGRVQNKMPTIEVECLKSAAEAYNV